MSDMSSFNYLVWGVLPYVCLTLFFVIPFLRMIYRPFGLTTRASGIFLGRDVLGLASHLLHWGIFLLLFGHIAGLVGGIQGWGGWVAAFFWMGTIGGVAALAGSVIALARRVRVPEMRAMSQPDDYIVHVFLIAILGVAIFQAVVQRIWGASFTAGPWFASLMRFQPQPELMDSAPLLTKIHIILAFAFAAYFPFTKLIHAWTLPVNYFVRPYQVLRTTALKFRNRWEFGLVSDKSYMTYVTVAVLVLLLAMAFLLPGPGIRNTVQTALASSSSEDMVEQSSRTVLEGYPLYVNQCARCHGLSGEGDGPGANSPTFSAMPRNLVDGHFRYVSSDNGVATNEDLRRVVTNGLHGSGMPAFAALSEAQVQSLLGVLDYLWEDRPDSSDPIEVPARPVVTAALIANGAEQYGQYCASCHGAAGLGDGEDGRDIRDTLGHRVLPRNLAREGARGGASSTQLYTRIAAGMPDGADNWLMPPFAGLDPQDIWAIVSFLEAEILRPRNIVTSTATE